MAANETLLGVLHELTANALIEKLKGTPILDEDGNPTGEVIPASAADIQAAAKFLKDNQITCAPSDDNAVGKLEQKLKERNQRRINNRPTGADLADAKADVSFLSGLN